MAQQRNPAEAIIVPPDGGWGWMVLIGSFIAYFIADGWAYSFGVIFPTLLEEFEEGRGKTALIGALLYGIPLLGSPIVCALTSAYGCRPIAMVGGLIAGVSFALSTFADSFNFLCLTCGVLASIGLSMIYVPSIVIVTYYFEKHRGLATGLAMVGSGLGAFAFPPLMEYLLNEFGWRYTMLLLGGIFLNVIPAGALFRPPPMEYPQSVHKKLSSSDQKDLDRSSKQILDVRSIEEDDVEQPMLSHEKDSSQLTLRKLSVSTTGDLESHDHKHGSHESEVQCHDVVRDVQVKHTTSMESIEKKKSPSCILRFWLELMMLTSKMLDRSLASSKMYMAFTAATFILYLFVGMPYVYLMDKAQLVDINETKAALLFSIIGIGRTIGQLVLGFLGDVEKVNTVYLYGTSITVVGVATLLVPVSVVYPALCVYSLVFGFFISVTYTLQMMCLIEMVGLERATNAFGLFQLIQGVATVLGTPVAGWLYEATQSYDSSFYVAGSLIAFSGLVVVPLPWMFK